MNIAYIYVSMNAFLGAMPINIQGFGSLDIPAISTIWMVFIQFLSAKVYYVANVFFWFHEILTSESVILEIIF